MMYLSVPVVTGESDFVAFFFSCIIILEMGFNMFDLLLACSKFCGCSSCLTNIRIFHTKIQNATSRIGDLFVLYT